MATLFFILLVISLPFPHWSITFFPWEHYKIATRGIEIHLADLCTWILFATIILRRRSFPIRWFPPLSWVFLIYLGIAVLGWMNAEGALINTGFARAINRQEAYPIFNTGLFPLFEIIKILRGYLLFWVSVNFFSDRQQLYQMIKIIPGILFFAAGYALLERYGYGMHRVSAGMEHPNVFNTWTGMLGALILPFAFAEKKLQKSLWYWSGILAALVAIVLTISRSSLAAYLLALSLGIIWGIRHYFKVNNLAAVSVALLCFAGIFIKSADTLFARFIQQENTFQSLKGRSALNEVAFLMAQEHPLGVGLGNFSAYSINRYAQLVNAEVGAMAHNIWYLTMGEMGYLGVISFALIWIVFYWILFKAYRKAKKVEDTFAVVFLAATFLALVVFHFQNLYHFTYRVTSIFFLSQILLGATVRISIDLSANATNRHSEKLKNIHKRPSVFNI